MARTRILLECTHTYESDLNTGIQRVVRNIVAEAEKVVGDFQCQPVIVVGKRLLTVKNFDNKIRWRYIIIYFLKKVYQKITTFIKKIFILKAIAKLLVPRFFVVKLTSLIYNFLDLLMFPLLLIFYWYRLIIPRKGDILLLLDCSWTYPIWSVVQKSKNNGAKIGLVVYDIVQISHPQFFEKNMTIRFQQWLDQSVNHIDFYIAISQTVRDEVRNYILSNYHSKHKKNCFDWFPLGASIDKINNDGIIRSELSKFCNKANTYLVVGTIEPRKNQKYVLDSFEKIWQKCPDVRLCFIGRTSWLDQDLPHRIKTHRQYKKNLLMLNDASDTELDYCYKNSRFLIFASLAEGYGLPIIEALNYGLSVLANNISIHIEVGKNYCIYFDANELDSLEKLIIDIEINNQIHKTEKVEKYHLVTWQESCRELLTKTIRLSNGQNL